MFKVRTTPRKFVVVEFNVPGSMHTFRAMRMITGKEGKVYEMGVEAIGHSTEGSRQLKSFKVVCLSFGLDPAGVETAVERIEAETELARQEYLAQLKTKRTSFAESYLGRVVQA